MQKAFSTEVRLRNMDEIGDVLASEIGKSHLTFKQLSESTGLCASTVSRMYYRETRFPRIQTVIALFEHFGYVVIARPSNVVAFNPYHKHKTG